MATLPLRRNPPYPPTAQTAGRLCWRGRCGARIPLRRWVSAIGSNIALAYSPT